MAAQERLTDIEEKLLQRAIRHETLQRFTAEFEKRPESIEQFDETTWRCLADGVTITVDGAVLRFKNGMEILVGIRAKK